MLYNVIIMATKKKDPQRQIRQGEELAQTTLTIMTGRQTPEDEEFMREFAASNTDSATYLRNMSDPAYLENQVADFSREGKTESLHALKRKIAVRKRNKHLRTAIISASSSAAAILLLLVVWQNRVEDGFDRHYIGSVETGFTKPTLLIGDNVRYDLDEPEVRISDLDNFSIETGNSIVYGSYPGSLASNNVHTIVIPKMRTYSATLSDGTRVTLNAGSRLSYPKQFDSDIREVKLEGEAYFDVQPSEAPFVVKTNNVNVRVYGTSFNVDAGHPDKAEVLLVRGSVGVSSNHSEKEHLISPNQLYRLDHLNQTEAIVDVGNTGKYLSWLNGSFYADNEPLVNIIGEIANWYGADFRYNSAQLSDITLSINIDMSYPLETVLDIIQAATDLTITKYGKEAYTIR